MCWLTVLYESEIEARLFLFALASQLELEAVK